MKRRSFIKGLSTTSITLPFAGCSVLSGKRLSKYLPDGEMPLRILGKTGIKVSMLGFGSHINKELIKKPGYRDKMIKLSYKGGINLYDVYNHKLEVDHKQFKPMGKSIKGFRNNVIVSLVAVKSTDQMQDEIDGALRDFNTDVSGKIALDAGASVGGFTDCLLQNGASRVYAVDAGFGQLAGKLRIDRRVVNMERTNISDVRPEQLDPKPVLATVDLSYLSLTKGIPIVSRLLDQKGQMLCLVKPLFEVSDPEIRRTGRIDDFSIYREVLSEITNFVREAGFCPIGLTHSHVTGNRGTREFFLFISLDHEHSGQDIHSDIDRVIEMAMKLPVFQKNY